VDHNEPETITAMDLATRGKYHSKPFGPTILVILVCIAAPKQRPKSDL